MAKRIDLGPEVASMSNDWRSAFFVSHQESKTVGATLCWRFFEPLLLREGTYIEGVGLPSEFSDWNGALVDLNIERLEDSWSRERLTMLFFEGCAMGLLKSRRWFALRTLAQGQRARSIEVVPISEESARRIVCFPENWERRVNFLKELPEGRKGQSKAYANIAVWRQVEIKPIIEEEAARMPQLPKDWEQHVETD